MMAFESGGRLPSGSSEVCQPKEIMKTIKLLLGLGTLSFLATAPPALAQSPPPLNLQLHAGVTLTGWVGAVYAMQVAANLGPTASWTTVDFVQLAATNQEWIDRSAVAPGGRRFYRALASAPTNLAF